LNGSDQFKLLVFPEIVDLTEIISGNTMFAQSFVLKISNKLTVYPSNFGIKHNALRTFMTRVIAGEIRRIRIKQSIIGRKIKNHL